MKHFLKTLTITVSVILIFAIITFLVVSIICYIDEVSNDFNRQLPKTSDKVEYVEGGFGDVIKYREFYYSPEKVKEFDNNKYFKKIQEADTQTIKGYFEHFEQLLKFFDYKEKYRFDKSQMKTGDYFYIESDWDEPYDDYDVFYVDVEKCVMYHIHFNL